MSDSGISSRASVAKEVLSRSVGFAFLQCWVLPMFSGFIPYGSALTGVSPAANAITSGVSIIVAFALFLTAPRISPLATHRTACTVAALSGCVGTILIASSTLNALHPLGGILGLALSAICITWLHLSYQESFSSHGARMAVYEYALGTIVGSAMYVLVGLLPQASAITIFALLPLLSRSSLKMHPRDLQKASAPSGQKTRGIIESKPLPHLLIIAALLAAVCGIACAQGVFVRQSTGLAHWIGAACGLSVASVLAGFTVSRMGPSMIARALLCAIPLSTLGALALAGRAAWSIDVGALLATCGFFLTNYMAWIVLIDRVRATDAPILGPIAFLWSICYASMLAGQAASALWNLPPQAFIYLMLTLLIVAALLLEGTHGMLRISKEALDKPEDTPVQRRAAFLAREHGLSPRETEILSIWLAGHNAAYIEKTLHISNSTVKTHLRSIYRKIGVESKEELISLLD